LIFKGYYFNTTFFVRFMYGTRELINENPKKSNLKLSIQHPTPSK